MQKIHPFLWFDNQAEEAARFYVSVFKNGKLGEIMRAPEGFPDAASGSVLTVDFEIEGLQFTALNGGPSFHFSEAISFTVDCKSQEEVDDLWSKLTADGGQEDMCGWLKDKFGLSWQITPSVLTELMSSPDREVANRVSQAMLKMRKIDIAEIQRAAAGA